MLQRLESSRRDSKGSKGESIGSEEVCSSCSLQRSEIPPAIEEDESDRDDTSISGLPEVIEKPSDPTESQAVTGIASSASGVASRNTQCRTSQRGSILMALQGPASAIRQSLSAVQSLTSVTGSFSIDQKQTSIGLTEQGSMEDPNGPPRRMSRRSFLVQDAANEPMMQKLEAAGFRGSVASEAMMMSPAATSSRWQVLRMRLRMARLHLWLFLEEPWYTKKACLVSTTMVLIITASVLNAVAVTQPHSNDEKTGWGKDEWPGIAFNVIFCIDLLVRFWAFPARCRFLSTPKNMVDFMSVLPFFVNKVCGLSLHVDALDFLSWLNAYEAFLRLVKLSRYFWGWQLLFRAVCDSIKALVIPMYFLLIMVFFGSCTLYVFENIEEGKQIDSGFYDPLETNIYRKAELGMVTVRSLSDAIHFSTICILSMSAGAHYGLQAASSMGQVTAGCLMAFGMLFMAMPIAIVGSVFSQTWFDQDRIVLLDKVRSRLRAQGYNCEDCEEVFDEVDKDRSGEIEFREFKKMLHSFHIEGLSRAKCQRLYRYFDLDGDGAINYFDFAGTLFPEMPLELHEEENESDSSSSSEDDAPETSVPWSTVGSIPSGQPSHRNGVDSDNASSWQKKKSDGKGESLFHHVVTSGLGMMTALTKAGSNANSRRGSLLHMGTKRGSSGMGRCSSGGKDTDSAGDDLLAEEISRAASSRSDVTKSGGAHPHRPDRGSLNSTGSLQMQADPLAHMDNDNGSFVVKEDVHAFTRKSLESTDAMSDMPAGESTIQVPRISNGFILHLDTILSRMDSNLSRLMRMTEKKNIVDNSQQVMSVFGPAITPTPQLGSRVASRRPSLTEAQKPHKVNHSRRPSLQHHPIRGHANAFEGNRDSAASIHGYRRPSVSSVAGVPGRGHVGGFGVLPGVPATPAAPSPFMSFFNPRGEPGPSFGQ